MTNKTDETKFEIVNPMYAGATPEDVGRTLMRQVDADRQENDQQGRKSPDCVQASI